jgi:hypothetical protein
MIDGDANGIKWLGEIYPALPNEVPSVISPLSITVTSWPSCCK